MKQHIESAVLTRQTKLIHLHVQIQFKDIVMLQHQLYQKHLAEDLQKVIHQLNLTHQKHYQFKTEQLPLMITKQSYNNNLMI